jgi:hypothetical protein
VAAWPTLASVIVADEGWPQSIWHSWWSLVFVVVLFLIRFTWIVLTADRDEDESA